MKNNSDFSIFDKPEISSFLFHPRPEAGSFSKHFEEISIPIENNIYIGARLYTADKKAPTILFFHGNGEIVEDYDDIAPLYKQMGINFFPVDYRGYGCSTGKPSVSAMMQDCHIILNYVKKWLYDNNYSGTFIVMGRSLGSASALELAMEYADQIDGLIIESGFAFAIPLLRLIGVNTDKLGLKEEKGFRNIEKIKSFHKPTLIIHSEFDQIIPFNDGQTLYNSSPAKDKKFVKISGADHNTIFYYGIKEYMLGIKDLIGMIKK